MKNIKKYKIMILLSYFIASFASIIFDFILKLLQYSILKLSGIDIINFSYNSNSVVIITISIIIYCLISIWENHSK